MRALLANLRNRAVDVHAHEVRAMSLGFIFNFIVLASYYVIRPIRDDIGAAGGAENLSWMFTATLIAMLIATRFSPRLSRACRAGAAAALPRR